MLIAHIDGATHMLGAPDGWTKDECGTLPVRMATSTLGPMWTSAWTPTPDELARLNAGASVLLTVHSAGHPPVSLAVGDA